MDYRKILAALVIIVSGTLMALLAIEKNTPFMRNILPRVKAQWINQLNSTVKEYTQQTTVSYRTMNSYLATPPGLFVPLKDVPPPVKPLSDKYIIYRCMSLCGGLADREKGIVTSYLVSQMLRRKFGLMMKRGCDFSKYVIPNLVDWVVSDEMVRGKTTGSKVNIDNFKLGIEMRDRDLNVMYDKDVMYYQGNIDFVPLLMNKTSYKTILWTKNKSHHDVFQTAIAHLFKLAPDTQRKYETFQEKISNKQLVCAHLRIGQSKTIPQDMARSFKPDVSQMIRFLREKMTSASKVFIATDSDEVRAKMKDTFSSQFIEMEGKIVHIDRPGGAYHCSGMEKAILDQYVLSHCDILVISQSGFSKVAAVLRGTDENLYLAVSKNITATKRLNPT